MGSTAEMSKDTIIIFSVFLTIISLFSCSLPFYHEGENLIQRYIGAVQKKDYKTLYELRADILDETEHLTEEEKLAHFDYFKKQMGKKYESYEAGRENGELDFDPDGVVLIKAFVLGKGTFYQPVDWIRVSETTAFIDTVLEFGYAHIDYSFFPEGTLIYLMGYPIGRVETLVIQRSGKVVKKVMKEAKLRWWFERKKRSNDVLSSWHIKSVEILPDSVTYETVTWVF